MALLEFSTRDMKLLYQNGNTLSTPYSPVLELLLVVWMRRRRGMYMYRVLLYVFTVRCYRERGYATVTRPSISVCPSVCRSVTFRLCFNAGWNTSKIISRTTILKLLLGLTQTSVGESGPMGTHPRLGWNRGAVMNRKPVISLKGAR